MRIGIDFDNTIAGFDDVFVATARAMGLVDTRYHGHKRALRDTIRGLPDGELAWQRLQGRVYGAGMASARLIDGVDAFLHQPAQVNGAALLVLAGVLAVSAIGRLTDPPDVVELWDWTLQPHDSFDGEAHPVGTVEVLSVLIGRLALRVGDADLELAKGDTAMFEAHAPHRYACAGSEAVRFTMVVLDPGDPDLVPPTSIAPAAPDQ